MNIGRIQLIEDHGKIVVFVDEREIARFDADRVEAIGAAVQRAIEEARAPRRRAA